MLFCFFVGIKNPDNSTHYKQFLKEVKCDFPLRPEGRSIQVDVKGVLADEEFKCLIDSIIKWKKENDLPLEKSVEGDLKVLYNIMFENEIISYKEIVK